MNYFRPRGDSSVTMNTDHQDSRLANPSVKSSTPTATNRSVTNPTASSPVPAAAVSASPSRVSETEVSSTGVGSDEYEALEYLMNSVRPFCDDDITFSKPNRNADNRRPSSSNNGNRDEVFPGLEDNADVTSIGSSDSHDVIKNPVDRRAEIPERITEDWLNDLQIIEPVDSEQYSNNILPTMIQRLQEFIETEEPHVEFKVSSSNKINIYIFLNLIFCVRY